MTLPTLADEVLALLPTMMAAHPGGATVAVVAEHLVVDTVSARKAMRRLNTEARAKMLRVNGSNRHVIVPNSYRSTVDLMLCAHCGKEFRQPIKSKRRCCIRSCGIIWSWTRPGVAEKRRAGIRAERATDAGRGRTAELNRKRWGNPEEHKRLSEWNKKRWADPAIKADTARAIKLAHSTPEKRKFYSDLRKKNWADSETRERYLKGMRRRRDAQP